MSSRDAMTFRLALGEEHREPGSASIRARELRRVDRQKRPGGALRRVAQYRLAQRVRSHTAARGAMKRPTSLLGVGTMMAAAATASIVALRLISGQPLEGTGAQVNDLLLGSFDDAARAKMATRRQIEGNQSLTRVAGRGETSMAQVSSVAKDLYGLELAREKGASKLREMFPANNTIDILIVRGAAMLKEAFVKGGGLSAIKRLDSSLADLNQITRGH